MANAPRRLDAPSENQRADQSQTHLLCELIRLHVPLERTVSFLYETDAHRNIDWDGLRPPPGAKLPTQMRVASTTRQ